MVLLFIHAVIGAALWTVWMLQDYLLPPDPCFQEAPLRRRRRRRRERYPGCNHRVICSSSGSSKDSIRAVCSETPSLEDVAEETPSQLPQAPKRQRIPFLAYKEQELLEWHLYKKHQEEDARSLQLRNILPDLQIPEHMLSPEPWGHSCGALMPYEGWYHASPQEHKRGSTPHIRSRRHMVQRQGSHHSSPGHHGRSQGSCIQRTEARAQVPGSGQKRERWDRRSPKVPKQRTRLGIQGSERQSPRGQGTRPKHHIRSPRPRNRCPVPLPYSRRNSSRSSSHHGESQERRGSSLRTGIFSPRTHMKSHGSHACSALPSPVELLSSLLPVSQSKSHSSLRRGAEEEVVSIEQKVLHLSWDDHNKPELPNRCGGSPKITFTGTAVISKDIQVAPLAASAQFKAHQESQLFFDRPPKPQSPRDILVEMVHQEEARQELQMGLPEKPSSPGRPLARGRSTSPPVIGRSKSRISLQGEERDKTSNADQKAQCLTWADISDTDFTKAKKKATQSSTSGQSPILQPSILGQNHLDSSCLVEVYQEIHRHVDRPPKPPSPGHIFENLVHEEEAKQELHMGMPKKPPSPGRTPSRGRPTSPPIISRSKSHISLQREGRDKLNNADQKTQWFTWAEISEADFPKANKKAPKTPTTSQSPVLQPPIMGKNQLGSSCLVEVYQESHRRADRPPKPQSPGHILLELMHEEETKQELHMGMHKKPSPPGRLPARGRPSSPHMISKSKSHVSLQCDGRDKTGSTDQKTQWFTRTEISEADFPIAIKKAPKPSTAVQSPNLQTSIIGQNQCESSCLVEVYQESHRSVDRPPQPRSPMQILVESVHEKELHLALPKRPSSPGRLPARELTTPPAPIGRSKSHSEFQGKREDKMDRTPVCLHPWQPSIPSMVYPQVTVEEEEVHMNLNFVLKVKKDQASKWGIEPEEDASWGQLHKKRSSEIKQSRGRTKLQKRYTKKSRPLGSVSPLQPERPPLIRKPNPRNRGRKAAPKGQKDSSTTTSESLAKPSKRRRRSRSTKPQKESQEPQARQKHLSLLKQLMLCLKKLWAKLRKVQKNKKKAHPKHGSRSSASHKQGSSSDRLNSEEEHRKENNESSEPLASPSSSSSTTDKKGHHWHQNVLFPQFLENRDFSSLAKRSKRVPKKRRPRETLD